MRQMWMTLLLTILASCHGVETHVDTPLEPYVVVLGTAQDGGLPHVGCWKAPCAAARVDPTKRRLVTSLLLVDPRSGKRWLLDASPDLPEQLELARSHPAGRSTASTGNTRPALFDGVFLTHAHMGHYTGLSHLGREVYGARDLPLFVTERMGSFLRGNDPWRWMVENGFLVLNQMEYQRPIQLAPDLTVTPIPVPHREEFSDTVAFRIEGPNRSLLYLPDIDKWERWEQPVEDEIGLVDIALLDGTFFADGELPGRAMKDIPHPFIVESLERFAALPVAERRKIHFTHLNHTNPAADPDGEATGRVQAAGMEVARDGMLFGL